MLLRAVVLLAFELLGSKSELPTGFRRLKNQLFSSFTFKSQSKVLYGSPEYNLELVKNLLFAIIFNSFIDAY